MANREPISVGEWYHCYARGVDKRKIFLSTSDYQRFLTLIYVANGINAVHVSNLKQRDVDTLIQDDSIQRGNQIVEVGAYSLMPNHVHFILKEIHPGGIARYMQKIFTGYTMYFNKKNNRTGALLSGTFKSKHLYDDIYLKHALAYVHMNPVELVESEWKAGVGTIAKIEKFLRTYKYSSLTSFSNEEPLRGLLGKEIFELFDKIPTTRALVEDAQAYYASTNIKVKP